MKKLVIDARIIETSTGRYMQRLIENLNEIDPEDFTITVLIPSQHVSKWQPLVPNLLVTAADQKWYSFAEQWSLYWQLRTLKPDLVHFTMPQQPLLWTRPAITTIHDSTLIRFENFDDSNPYVYKLKQFIFTRLIHTIARRAKQVLTPTEFVKNDLLSIVGEKYRDKFTVTLEAGEPSSDPVSPLKEFEGKKFFFSVGNAFPYKNVGRIIKGFSEFQKKYPDTHLLLAGKKEYFYEQLEKEVREKQIPNVHFLGFISDGEKRWALQHAEAFIYASLSEGFCITVLESMYESCPAILSNATCLPEVGGDAAIYFDPHSTDALLEQMEAIYTTPQLRNDLIKKGSQRVKKFSWRKMADETLEIYRRCI